MIEHKDAMDALSRVSEADGLKSSPTLQRILSYVVSEELEGRGQSIKSFSIAVDALGKPESFDPHSDPIVRVNFGRLRKALRSYYAKEGKGDPVKIEIPKGAYRPVFSIGEMSLEAEAADRPRVGYRVLGSPRMLLAVAGLCLLAAVLFGLPPYLSSSRVDEAVHAQHKHAKITVMVRATPRFSQDDDTKAQSAGFIRELRAALSRNDRLLVILPDDLAGDDGAEGRASRRGDVDFLIDGIVQKLGENRSISIELINGRKNEIVWARSYRLEPPLNASALQAKVQQLARELNVQVFGASIRDLEDRDPDTLSAPQLFVLATWVPGPARNTLAWEKERVRLARLAIAKDPDFGPAHSVLADKLAYLSSVDGPSDTSKAEAEARSSARRALELSAGDANALFNVAQYQWHSGQLHDSMRTLKRVMDLDPNNALARFFLNVYPFTCVTASDDVLKSAIAFDQSLSSDNPIRWVTLTWLGWLHLNREEYELALEAEERAAQIFQIPYTVMRHAAILNQLGRHEEAAELIISQRANWPNIDPEHFSTVTMPRLCQDFSDGERMLGYYNSLSRSMKNRLAD